MIRYSVASLSYKRHDSASSEIRAIQGLLLATGLDGKPLSHMELRCYGDSGRVGCAHRPPTAFTGGLLSLSKQAMRRMPLRQPLPLPDSWVLCPPDPRHFSLWTNSMIADRCGVAGLLATTDDIVTPDSGPGWQPTTDHRPVSHLPFRRFVPTIRLWIIILPVFRTGG
jgi:hypothetical protein